MIHNTKPISPLRQRMIDDMTFCKRAPQTQAAYVRAVKNFTRFLGRSPDTAGAEDEPRPRATQDTADLESRGGDGSAAISR